MKKTCFSLIMAATALSCFAGTADNERDWNNYPLTPGPYDRTDESLNKWECPEWFKDAKLGMWLITGPQAVPKMGDFYAKYMYVPGDFRYSHHISTYGHPSEFGYKDIIGLYNPEKLDFSEIIGLYKDAGAKYVMMLAVHIDNYDLWDSKHHEWNSVKKSPHRDLAAEFRAAAEKHNIHYGYTTHGHKMPNFLMPTHGSDEEGPMKGVPYDGANPEYKSLYCADPADEPGIATGDFSEPWKVHYYNRLKDLIDSYQPDLFYIDCGMPFARGDHGVGNQITANFYNQCFKKYDSQSVATMFIKRRDFGDKIVVDYERHGVNKIQPVTWQVDTCIGNWYYNLHQLGKYKDASFIVYMLADVVSKNGNLLLNVPLHPSGEFQQEELAFLKALGKWMKVNGEGIYGTKPWLVFGEGDVVNTSYSLSTEHNEVKPVPAEGDFRFTAKGDTTVYAISLFWPEDGKVVIRSLANENVNNAEIDRVTMLGSSEELSYQWTREGLMVQLPKEQPCKHAWTLKVEGKGLRNFNLPRPAQKVYANKAVTIPCRIEAEDYDKGGQLVAYHDTTAGNLMGAYRKDDVDIALKDGATYIDAIEDGEWLEYTIDLDTGIYEIYLNAGSSVSGNSATLYLDDKPLGTTKLFKTGDRAAFKPNLLAKATFKPERGKILKIKFNGSGIRFDALEFRKTGMPETIEIYLSDLNWVKHESPTSREPSKDRDRDGDPLIINGKNYEKGIGCDSQVTITYDLNGQYVGFASTVGLDDDVDHSDSADLAFQVFLDGRKAYDSGVMKSDTPAKEIHLDVTGVKEMKLHVDDANGSRNADHANWAEARLIKKVK